MLKLKSETFAFRHTFGAAIVGDVIMSKELLRRKGKLLIISTQDGGCVKMRCPLSEHQRELDTFNAMSDAARNCFVPILAAFEFEARDGATWGGLCMPFIDTTLNCIMPSSLSHDSIAKRFAASLDASLAASLDASLDASLAASLAASLDARTRHTEALGLHGLQLKASENFTATLLSACFGLLLTVHKCGWVHGDTHMGNFMLDSTTWRVFLIDTERSFQSTDPVQHLLDAQELAGHATGLLVALHDKAEWDMGDVWAVASKRQRLEGLANFMPVCSCFAEQNSLERIRGCPMCRSNSNVHQASLYLGQAHKWAEDTHTLDKLSGQIADTRQDFHCELRELGKKIQPHLCTIKRFLRNDMTNITDKRALLRSLSNYSIIKWLRFTLYRGAIMKGGAKQARRFVIVLRACGLPDIAMSYAEMICS
jgi:hypothetical protein